MYNKTVPLVLVEVLEEMYVVSVTCLPGTKLQQSCVHGLQVSKHDIFLLFKLACPLTICILHTPAEVTH